MPNDFYIPPRKSLKWMAIDLDGTLAYSTWEAGQKRSVVGDPIPENIEKLRELVAHGYKPIIHTARHWSDYELIEAWVQAWNLPIERILCGKVLAHRYIDDRAIKAEDITWLP